MAKVENKKDMERVFRELEGSLVDRMITGEERNA
jgi:hypothetical protein